MRTLSEQLGAYASYHRDPRNIATHCVGIPLIVLGAVALMSRPAMEWQHLRCSAAVPAVFAASWFYLQLDRRYGLVMAALLAAALDIGARVAALGIDQWLALSLSAFVLGWVFQFLGHLFEGRKPAFLDDLASLLIGPLFVVAELGFRLGLRRPLAQEISRRVVAGD